MPVAKIDFASGQASGVEELSSPDAMPLFSNVIVEVGKAIRRRPGISAYYTGTSVTEDGTGNANVIGVFVWNDKVIYVTANRYVHVLQTTTTSAAISTSTITTQLAGSARPVFAASDDLLVITGGGAPLEVNGNDVFSLTSSPLDGSPPNSSHVVIIGRRIVLAPVDSSGLYYWSDLGPTETFDALSFAEAEARPDPIVALGENTNLLWIFGTTTTQVHDAVGTDPLLPFEQLSVINYGCGAPYSPIQVDDAFAWLDNKRRFVMSGGKGAEPISTPDIGRTLFAMETVEDCWGFRRRMDGCDQLIWVFPTEKLTLVFDMDSKTWSRETGFADGNDIEVMFTAYASWDDQNLHLVGLDNGQLIGQFDSTAVTDLGTTIRSEGVSGFYDHGSKKRKRCNRVSYTLRRGVAATGSTPGKMEVAYRNDLGAWSDWSQISLENVGQYDPVALDFPGGIYRTRQYRFRYSGTDPFTYASAEEDYTELDS